MGSTRQPVGVLNALEHDSKPVGTALKHESQPARTALEHDGEEFNAILLQTPLIRITGGDDVEFRGRLYTLQDIHENHVVLSEHHGFLAVHHTLWGELRPVSVREALKQ